MGGLFVGDVVTRWAGFLATGGAPGFALLRLPAEVEADDICELLPLGGAAGKVDDLAGTG